MTESIGHEQAFWKKFMFLLKNAVAIGIYDSIDYQQQPEPYCGMTIDDNPLYA
jgi:hypothetical protein